MRQLAAALLGLLLTTHVASAIEICSCMSNDGQCTANITCTGGCIAYCPNGACRARCVSGPAGEGGDEQIIQMRVTLKLKGGTPNELAAALANITGREVIFVPLMPEHPISLDVKGAPLWDVLEILSESGKVRIGGEDFSTLQTIRRALVTGERISVCIRGTSVRRVVDELAALSGLPIRITGGDGHKLLTLAAKDVTLDEILTQMSDQTGVQIGQR